MPTLHDYQRVAVDHLHRNPRAGLFLDMGLGKTATVLSALTPEHLPVLVVAPKRVAEHVWSREARLWRPDLRVTVAAGTKLQRQQALSQRGADIIVIGRDNLADINDKWPAGKHPFKTFVMDELSSFKNRASVRWKAARKIAASAQYVWGLTGTPAPNGLMDLWAQVYLLDRGQRLGATLTSYRGRYFYPGRQLANGVITEWLPRPEAPIRIQRSLEDICISMATEGRVTLPPVTYNRVEVPLSPVHRRQYDKLRRDLVLQADDIGVTITAPTAAALSTKLAQMTAGFIYTEDDTGQRAGAIRLHGNKVQATQEIIDGTGSPVLVFYRFVEERDMLLSGLDNAHTIDEPGVIDDWNAGKIPVLVAHPASIGHGLNLQAGGHTIVWTTATWSLEEWEQSNKRLARQGQQNPVIIHTLVAPSTVDDLVLKALQGKASVQDALLDHLESVL